MKHAGYAKILHVDMSAGDFERDVDARHGLADDIVCAGAFRFELAGHVAIEMLSADEIGIRDFLFRIALVADHALSHCELLYGHAQAY